ncbi:MAG: succinylglutamate desuccinylase/aspartoacylase family protein [bacterium]
MKHIHIKIPGHIIEIPYLHYKGSGSEKICVISAGMHGDEVNGISLAKNLIEYCDKNDIEKELNGELIVLPICNQSGFENQTRHVAYDNKDLNRCFHKKDKTASNLIANALERHFYSKADLAIDCHDSGKRQILLPHTRVHTYEDQYCTNCTREMAKAFGSKIIIERKGKKGMLAIEMSRKHKLPILTIEIGGALKVAHKHLEKGLEGILNILKSQGFLPGEVKVPSEQFYLKYRFGVPAKYTGILNLSKKLGSRVHMGDKIGDIYVPKKAKTYDVISPMCGIIFSMQLVDVAKEGEIIYSILEDRKCHRKRRMTSGMVEELKNIKM